MEFHPFPKLAAAMAEPTSAKNWSTPMQCGSVRPSCSRSSVHTTPCRPRPSGSMTMLTMVQDLDHRSGVAGQFRTARVFSLGGAHLIAMFASGRRRHIGGQMESTRSQRPAKPHRPAVAGRGVLRQKKSPAGTSGGASRWGSWPASLRRGALSIARMDAEIRASALRDSWAPLLHWGLEHFDDQ